MADKMWDILRFLKNPEGERETDADLPPATREEKNRIEDKLVEALTPVLTKGAVTEEETEALTGLAAAVPLPAAEDVAVVQPQETQERLIDIPIAHIRPNPFQPRKLIGEEEMHELADSIRELGVLQPVIVRRVGDSFELIAGERRYQAAQRAGLSVIPAVVVEADEVRQQVIALVENIQRKNLSSIEEARCLRDIMSRTGWSQTDMARRLGRSQAAVANKIRLLKLDPSVQELVVAGKLGERQARSLLSLSQEEQSALAQKAVEEDLSARVLENLSETWQNRSGTPHKRQKRKETAGADGPAGELLRDLASLVAKHKEHGVPASWNVKKMDQSSLIVEIYVDLHKNKGEHEGTETGGGE